METEPDRTEVRTRIVDAAARLLREHGPGAVTTRGVAEQAGVQAPAIYRLFGDKDGLLDAVAEHVLATFATGKRDTAQAAADDDLDPVHDLRAGWRHYVEFGITNPALFVLLSDPVRAHHSPAVRSGLRVLEARVHRLALGGRLGVGEARAVALIHAAGTGAVLTLLATPSTERDAALADELFEAVLNRILTDPPDPGPDGPITAAVTLRAAVPHLGMLSAGEQSLLREWLDRTIDAGRRTTTSTTK